MTEDPHIHHLTDGTPAKRREEGAGTEQDRLCPFSDDVPHFTACHPDEGIPRNWGSECVREGCCVGPDADTEAECRAKWNTRPQEDRLRARIAELEAACAVKDEALKQALWRYKKTVRCDDCDEKNMQAALAPDAGRPFLELLKAARELQAAMAAEDGEIEGSALCLILNAAVDLIDLPLVKGEG